MTSLDLRLAETSTRLPRWYSRVLALVVLSLIVLEVGFLGAATPWIKWTTAALVTLFALEHALNWHRCPLPATYLRHWSFRVFMASLAVGVMLPALVFLPSEGQAQGNPSLIGLGIPVLTRGWFLLNFSIL